MYLADWTRRKLNAVNVRLHMRRAGEVFDSLVVPGTRPVSLAGLTREQAAVAKFALAGREAVRTAVRSPGKAVRPTISVVIPHYNHSAYLRACLQGLCSQTDTPDEVVLIDDRSDDVEAVKAVVAEFERKLNLHAVYSKEKLYCGGARQLGAERASKDIVVMHDADDLSHRQRMEFTRTFFSETPDAVQMNTGFMVTSALPLAIIRDFSQQELRASIVPTAEIGRALRGVYTRNRFSQGRRPSLHSGSYGFAARFGCCAGHVAYRRDIVPILRWTSPNHYLVTRFEDFEFNMLLFLMSLRSYQVDLPLLYYRAGTTTNKM